MKYGCGMVIVETNISMNGMHYELVFEQNVNVSVIPWARQAGTVRLTKSDFKKIRPDSRDCSSALKGCKK